MAARRAAVAAAILVLVACRGDGVDRVPSALYGEVRFAGPLLVAPDLRWRPEGDAWRFVLEADLAVAVAATPEAPFVLRIEAASSSREHRFVASWDGAPLPDAAVVAAAGVTEVVVAPEWLTPGRHRLGLARDRRHRRCRGCERHESDLTAVEWRLGDAATPLLPGDGERLHRIADFLLRGVVGDDAERRAGVLFVGPRTARFAPGDGGGVLRLEPENLSASPATLAAAAGDVRRTLELAPGERGLVELPLAATGAEVELAVTAGAADGLVLWGLPLVDGGRRDGGPTPIVVVTLDTTRRDAVAPYSGRPEVTPRLAELAERATVFEHAWSTAPWTLPSHASVMTGLYPSRHGAGVRHDQISPDAPTLATLLRRAGYLPAGFSSGELTSYRFGLGLGFAVYRDPDQFETKGARTLAYVEEHVDRYADWPPFLFVNLFDPHGLYLAPEPFAERLRVPELARALAGQPLWEELAAGDPKAWKAVIEGEAPPSEAAHAWLRAAYHAEVAYADDLVGRIVDLLERHDLFERSLFVVTADHGELLGEGGFYSHSARLDPELVEIPLIVKFPGQTEPRRVREAVSLVDLYPTVLAAAGVAAPASDGLELAMGGVAGGPRPHLFLEEHEFRVHPLDGRMKIAPHLYGVQKPSFRQVVWEGGGLCARRRGDGWDDVVCGETGEDVLRRVEAVLGPRLDGRPEDAGVVPEELRRSLEALGYL